MGRPRRKFKSSKQLEKGRTAVSDNANGSLEDLKKTDSIFAREMMEVSLNDQGTQRVTELTEVETSGYSENLPIEISGMTTQVITSIADLPPHIMAEMIQQGTAHGIQAQFYQINSSDGSSTIINGTQLEMSSMAGEEIITQQMSRTEDLVDQKHQVLQGQSGGEPTGLTDEDRQVAATLVAIQRPQRSGGPTLGLVSSGNGQIHTFELQSHLSQQQHNQNHQAQIMSQNQSHMSLQAATQLINPVMVNIEIKAEKVEGDGSVEEVVDQNKGAVVQLHQDKEHEDNARESLTHHMNGNAEKNIKKPAPRKRRAPQKAKSPDQKVVRGSRSNAAKQAKPDTEATSTEVALYQQQNNAQQESNNFFCNVCRTQVGVSEFSEFYEHLKMHFESSTTLQQQTTSSTPSNNTNDYQATSNLVDPSASNTSQSTNRFFPQTSALRDLEPQSMEDSLDYIKRNTCHSKRVYKPDNNGVIQDVTPPFSAGAMGNSSSSGVEDCADKSFPQCQKCKRTFRREKALQAHILSCQKDDLEDEEEEFDTERESIQGNLDAISHDERRSQADMTDESFDEEGIELDEDDPMLREEEMEFELEEDEVSTANILLEGNACPACEEVYPTRAKLEVHLKKVHPELASSVKAAKKKKGTGPRKQEVLKCTECNRIFNHRNSLVYHMRSHTGERPHQCEMCGKSFFATSALKVHMRLHSGEKPYKCDHCGRNFRQWGDLKYHVISIHSDIRQYQCEFCGKDFARKYSLIVHRRIHTGERNYKCEFCSKCFRAASYLQNHRRIHTGEKPHACSICGKPFRVRSDMKRHMSSHNRDHHNHNHSSSSSSVPVSTAVSTRPSPGTSVMSISQQISQTPQIQPGTAMITVSQANQIQHIAQVLRGQTIHVPSTSTAQLVQQHMQHVPLDDSNEEHVISGDLGEGTPISITLSQDTPGVDDSSLNLENFDNRGQNVSRYRGFVRLRSTPNAVYTREDHRNYVLYQRRLRRWLQKLKKIKEKERNETNKSKWCHMQ